MLVHTQRWLEDLEEIGNRDCPWGGQSVGEEEWDGRDIAFHCITICSFRILSYIRVLTIFNINFFNWAPSQVHMYCLSHTGFKNF